MPVRLFVGNLSYDATEAELREHFGSVGPVTYCYLPTDRETGRPRGFAFVEFGDDAHAQEAISRLNNQTFRGRPLAVKEAQPRESRPAGGGGPRTFGGPPSGPGPHMGAVAAHPGPSVVVRAKAALAVHRRRPARRDASTTLDPTRPPRARRSRSTAAVPSNAVRRARSGPRPTGASTTPSAMRAMRPLLISTISRPAVPKMRRAVPKVRRAVSTMRRAVPRIIRSPRTNSVIPICSTVPVKQLICSVLLAAAAVGCQKPSPAASSSAAKPSSGAAPAVGVTPAPAAPAKLKPVPAVLPDTIAKVGGESISKSDLEAAIRSVEQQNGGRSLPPERRDEIYRGVLDNLVSIRVLRQEVADRHMTASDADIAAHINELRKQFPSEAAFKQAMAMQHVSQEKLRDDARMDLLVNRLLENEVNSQALGQAWRHQRVLREEPRQVQAVGKRPCQPHSHHRPAGRRRRHESGRERRGPRKR